MYMVYAIGTEQDLSTNLFACYVGVTNNPPRRWSGHCRSPYTVGEAIRQNQWTFDKNFKILFVGDQDECFMKEEELRPFPFMGLNEAPGGRGGYTVYSIERNEKISKKLAGHKRSTEHCKKISEAKKVAHVGPGNPKSKTWILTSPSGIVYTTTGELQRLCDELGLCRPALRSCLGAPVPAINVKYTCSDQIKRQMRINTTGWTLTLGE